jgi:predicted transcriptional regulator
LKQGDLENLIMNALWHNNPNGVGPDADENERGSVEGLVDVQLIQDWINQSNRQWAYTTVKTVLDRLVEKGLVTRNKKGKKFFYGASVGRDEAGLMALEKLLRQYYQNNLSQLKNALAVLEKAPKTASSGEESIISLLQPSAQSGSAKASKQTKTLDQQTKPLKKTAV